VFQLTIRSLSATEISDDPVRVARLKKLYDILDNGTTPATVLVPWLPTPAMIRKLWATKDIYDIVIQAITDRERSGISRNDTLQMLLDFGDERLVVVGVGFLQSQSAAFPPESSLTQLSMCAVYHGTLDCRGQSDGHDRWVLPRLSRDIRDAPG
jgi:hypothetical protein